MTPEQFDRARAMDDPGVLIHLVCNEADATFYSETPDALSLEQRTVLCAETYFSAVCDGGFASWFDADHGQLACCGPASLRRLGLEAHAALAEKALRLHHDEPFPASIAEWDEHLHRIRSEHEEQDCSEWYAPLDAEFFTLCHDRTEDVRQRLFDYIVQNRAALVQAPAQPVA